MFDLELWKWFIPGSAILLLLVTLNIKGFGVLRLERLNSQRMKEIEDQASSLTDSRESFAFQVVMDRCRNLNEKWFLNETDLDIMGNTRHMIEDIAKVYYPESPLPWGEVRVGKLLRAFEDLRDQLLIVNKWPGVSRMTCFRLRHALILARAWRMRKQLLKWKFTQFLKRYRLLEFFKWVLYLAHWVDITFWAMRMSAYIFHHLVLRVFLVRWYLIIGDIAVRVYRDCEDDPGIESKQILEELYSMSEEQNSEKENLPEEIQKICRESQKEILLHSWNLEWVHLRSVYLKLVEDIARFHHPSAGHPLYEARLSKLIEGGSRFAGKIVQMQDYQFMNPLMGIKVSHIIKAREATDFMSDSRFLEWVRKYHLRYIIKYATVLFRAIRKGNRALVFRDFAFTLLSEASKRWFYLYLLNKIATEANLILREPGSSV